MKKIYMVLAALMLIIVMTGCDSQQADTTAQADTTINTVDTRKKVSYKDARVYYENGIRRISLNPETSTKMSKINNSIQGDLALKSWLFSNVDSYQIFIIDKHDNFIEWYGLLEYGEKYTIYDEEYKYQQTVMRGEDTFIFSDELDGFVITLSLEIQPFFVDLSFQLEQEVLYIYQNLDFDTYYQEFEKTDKGYKITAHLNEEYIVETYSGEKYSISMTYSNMLQYLETGNVEMKKLGGIGGITWANTTVSFERMLEEGMPIIYDSLIDEGKYISFTFDVKLDVEIYFDSESVEITIDNIPIVNGTILKTGSKVRVEFYNEAKLKTRIDLQKYEEIEIEVSLEELLEESVEVEKVDYDVSIEELFEDLLGEPVKEENNDEASLEELFETLSEEKVEETKELQSDLGPK